MAEAVRMLDPRQSPDTEPIALVCQSCGNAGTFVPFGPPDFLPRDLDARRVGLRRCPNPKCLAVAFVVSLAGELVETYPLPRLTFDHTGIPIKVLAAFEEAMGAHANELWMAAGMMIRKTLEEICADQGADAPNLHQRIASLGQKIIIPKALLDGMDQLRLLGNDAAHVEIRHFQAVSKEEIQVGIEITLEILRATYQLQNLLDRITQLRAGPSSSPA